MQTRAGFSLVELSIVIAIIGLILGGVVAGKSLISGGEQRAIVAEFKSYDQAFGAFIDQYNYPPGDLPNATSYWGAVNSVAATCRTTESFSTATCDGTGDGIVGSIVTSTASTQTPAYGNNYEWFLAWKHLANAGLIDGRFADKVYSANTSARPGYNVPKSASGLGGYTIFRMNTWPGGPATFVMNDSAHFLLFGSEVSTAPTAGPTLTPLQARDIDQKLDDGRPGTGKIMAYCVNGLTYASSPCTTTAVASTAAYAIRTADPNTALWYELGK